MSIQQAEQHFPSAFSSNKPTQQCSFIASILKITTDSLKAYQLDGSFIADFKFMQPTPSL